MPNIDEIFTAEAEERIRAAVERAEEGTSGEIVPYVVAASDSYEGVLWKGAALGAMLGALLAALSRIAFSGWGPAPPVWFGVPPMVGAGIGYLLTGAIPSLRRALIGPETLERRTWRRAAVAFLEEEVFRTDERTGILLFLSLFEQRVVVLGDEGINRKVAQDEWDDLVQRVVRGVRAGEPVAALEDAIRRCGELLHRRGLEIQPDDVNELADDLRSREH